MNYELENELEYFEFLPAEFHTDLYTAVQGIVLEHTEDKANRAEIDKIEEVLERNMLIFERFTLRNIFRFADEYGYERRDEIEESAGYRDAKDKMLALLIQKEKLAERIEACRQKQRILNDLTQCIQEVEGTDDVKSIEKGVQELSMLVKHAREIKNKYIQSMPQEKPMKKEVEEETRRRECIDMQKRIPMDILKNLEKVMADVVM